jgi:tetratricopeptide (TPR) repeat protein
MKSILLLNFVLGFFWAQSTFTVVGSVRNQSGQAVSGVRVSVMDENFQPIRTIFVDSSGRFTVRGLGQGRFTFRVETTGTPYEEQTQQLELQALRIRGGNESFPLDITLKFKKGKEPGAGSASVFVQEVPAPARKEYESGVKSLKGQKTDQAIASLKKAIQIFPDYYDALELLGTEYIKAAQFEVALPLLSHALEVNKRSFKCMYGLGVARLKLNQLPQAVEHLEKAAQMEPNNANAQMMLGLAYGTGGAFDKSEAAFRKALEIGGEAAAEAHFYLAGLFNKQERYSDARQELEQFLKEGKNVKDPAQIKAMIEKLKDKEKSPPAQTQPAPAAPASSSDNNQNSNQSADGAEPVGSATPDKAASSINAVSLKAIPPLAPEFVELIRQSETAGGAMHKHLLDYTYQLKKTRRVLDDRGKSIHTQEQVFEAYPVVGEHVLIKLSDDGIPSRTVSDERKRAAKQLEEAERQRHSRRQGDDGAQAVIDDYVSAGVSGVYNGKPGYVSVNVSAFLRNCEFFSPRVEDAAGRPMVVMNFRPRPGAQVQNNFSYVSKLIGTVWIDQSDKIVTRLEGWPASEEAFDLIQSTAPQNDAALVYRQERQADGRWFPALIRLNANGRTDLFNGLNWEVVFEFGSYRRFDTSANEKISNPSSKTP